MFDLVDHAQNIMVRPAWLEQVVRLLEHLRQLLSPNEAMAVIRVNETVINIHLMFLTSFRTSLIYKQEENLVDHRSMVDGRRECPNL